ncbi:two component transcriptional regulator, LuxR family [Marinococcus luteus]|uniref:Two component transcriptional regulator, LuxR family n=1 Tax=Marinococcus luteus TaxID=1122204 RepID=A0A1H2TI14_9BACI|nr:response regulator transcription factor [Marinococcus luteus]SDW43407.1 two component transcriptional regulator, LuxR family [Marinococcus luteus]
MDTVRIGIVDDHAIVRDGLAMIMELEEDLEVVGIARNGAEAEMMLTNELPDVVMLDVYLEGNNGIEWLPDFQLTSPQTKFIMLSSYVDAENVIQALANGAKGFLLKDWESDELVRCVRQVAHGQMVLPTSVSETLSDQLAARNRTDGAPHFQETEDTTGLSLQDRRIMDLLLAGYSNQEIADTLFLTLGTVKNYLTAIYRKIGVRNRREAIAYFQRRHKETGS